MSVLNSAPCSISKSRSPTLSPLRENCSQDQGSNPGINSRILVCDIPVASQTYQKEFCGGDEHRIMIVSWETLLGLHSPILHQWNQENSDHSWTGPCKVVVCSIRPHPLTTTQCRLQSIQALEIDRRTIRLVSIIHHYIPLC